MARFHYVNDLVLSPCTTFLIKHAEAQAIRLSHHRAYRSPSVINNFLRTTLTEPLVLSRINPALPGPEKPYLIPINVAGNQELTETSLDAYEIGYTGVVAGRTVLS